MSTLKTTNITHESNTGTTNLALGTTGNVTIGGSSSTTDQGYRLTLQGSANASYFQFFDSTTGTTHGSDGTLLGLINGDTYLYNREAKSMIFGTSNNERMRIASDGDVGIGTSSPSFKLHVKEGDVDKCAEFANSRTADNSINYISVALNAEGTTGSALFGHTGHSTAGSQCAWIGNGGDDVAGGYGVKVFRGGNVVMMQRLLIGVSGGANNVSGSDASSQISYSKTYRFGLHIRPSDNNTGGGQPVLFQNQAGTSIGSISADASNVAYNTSSDYRLKENDVKISNGITRLKQLRPIRFNWKADSEKTVDGFFAHEVSSVVPEAVTGTKDQTWSNGAVNPQQLDHSKLVPLLTAALQEAITEIEKLKTTELQVRDTEIELLKNRVSALESG